MTQGLRLTLMLLALGSPGMFMQTSLAQAVVAGGVQERVIQQEEQVVEEGEAEVEQAGGAVPLMAFMGTTPGKLLGARQFQLNQIFALEIQRLGKICDLNDSQTAKLTVGAKGVVKKMVEEFRKEPEFSRFVEPDLAQPPGGIDDDNQKQSENKVIEVIEVKTVEDIDQITWQMIDMGDSPSEMFKHQPPTEHRLWLKVVSSTLTGEQQQTLDEFRRQEKQKLRALSIQMGLEQFSAQLSLRDEQKEPFQKLIEAKFDKFDKLPAIYRSFQFLFAVASINSEDLKKVLDDPQYNYMQITVAPMKSMLEELDAIEDPGGIAPQIREEEIKK